MILVRVPSISVGVIHRSRWMTRRRGSGINTPRHGASTPRAILQLHIAQHGVIFPESSLALAHDDIECDGSDEGGGSGGREGEKGLVDATDGNAGGVAPVGGGAGGEDGLGHAPAEETQGGEPENEQDGVVG